MNNKFDILEKKLNIANDLIEELDFDDYEITLPQEMTNTLVSHPGKTEESTTEVFSLDSLKADFILIRQNIMKLINTGQRVLESASLIDPSDMKASQLMALSQLQQTLGNNLKLLVDVYKEIVNIEKTRSSVTLKQTDQPGIINQGTVINNQVLFSGDTNQLLDFLKENQKS